MIQSDLRIRRRRIVCWISLWLAITCTAIWVTTSPVAASTNQRAGSAPSMSDQRPDEQNDEERDDQQTTDGKQDNDGKGLTRRQSLIASLTIFVLAIFVGFEVITKVPPTLHTPLMSGSNAISGITLVGAIIVAGAALDAVSFIGFLAVVFATINVVGGFWVTHRMLAMFKKR